MSSAIRFLDSTIGKKVLMALTGLFLCSFLVVHVSGNLQLFKNDEGLAFNQYTVFMTTFVPVKIISYLLYITVLIHVLNGYRITLKNRKARPVGYSARKDPRSSSWASKNMAVLGTIVLVFLITHLANFWYVYKFGDMPWTEYVVDFNSGVLSSQPYSGTVDAASLAPQEYVSKLDDGTEVKKVIVKDLYKVVKVAFRESWLVALYVLGMVALAYHLVHGFQSSFQTLGIRPRTYEKIIRGIGVWVFGIIIPIAFAAMPVYFYFFVQS